MWGGNMDLKIIKETLNKSRNMEDKSMTRYHGLLNNEELTNMDRKALKIEILRNLPRIKYDNAAILVTEEDNETGVAVGVAYVYEDGSIHRATRDKCGVWGYNKATCYCNTTSNYMWTELPKTTRFTGTKRGLQVGAHVLAGILLDMYDYIDLEMLRSYELNHKNWCSCDNRPCNMEVVTKGDNINHKVVKQLLIEDGSYELGLSLEATKVTEAMQRAIGDIDILKSMLGIKETIVRLG